MSGNTISGAWARGLPGQPGGKKGQSSVKASAALPVPTFSGETQPPGGCRGVLTCNELGLPTQEEAVPPQKQRWSSGDSLLSCCSPPLLLPPSQLLLVSCLHSLFLRLPLKCWCSPSLPLYFSLFSLYSYISQCLNVRAPGSHKKYHKLSM